MDYAVTAKTLRNNDDNNNREKISKTIQIFCFFRVSPLGRSFNSSRFGLKCVRPSPNASPNPNPNPKTTPDPNLNPNPTPNPK